MDKKWEKMRPTMISVFMLWYIQTLSADKDGTKLLGVYSNRETEEQKYKLLPGFCEQKGEFVIDEHVIDKDHWEEEFISKNYINSET